MFNVHDSWCFHPYMFDLFRALWYCSLAKPPFWSLDPIMQMISTILSQNHWNKSPFFLICFPYSYLHIFRHTFHSFRYRSGGYDKLSNGPKCFQCVIQGAWSCRASRLQLVPRTLPQNTRRTPCCRSGQFSLLEIFGDGPRACFFLMNDY